MIPRDGRIITFYSFKGGVGRTMALANVAFLAALNGKRVLVMDWDLEAPGLHYYFRGMQDPIGARAVRTAPGVLDLVWGWSNALHRAQSTNDVEKLFKEYSEGTIFESHVRPILPDLFAANFGKLDHIGAGALTISVPEQVTYEEALAKFDWSNFFSEEAGGVLLNAFRNWAKAEYDYVFLDSRTGFADVAGVCTMQLPDVVALCYIYNRQNIDGIAQVAGAIRAKRESEVVLRSVPMRVARENTSEEADARARARKELTRRGGFISEIVESDQKQLSIYQAPNVPFYETIALIASDRPRGNQLAQDYMNLASQLLGEQLEMPSLEPSWVEGVRRRLQPRQAAPEYILSLQSKDPHRGMEEITQLLEGALEEQIDSDTDSEYLEALIGAAIHFARNAEDASDSEQMLTLTLDLLRSLVETQPKKWRQHLSDFLEFYLEQMAVFLDADEELLLLDEADVLLSTLLGREPKIKRLTNRRRSARLQMLHQNREAAEQLAEELERLIDDVRISYASDEVPVDLLAAEMDLAILRGDIRSAQGEFPGARRLYEKGLKAVDKFDVGSRTELVRLRFDLHGRLARLPTSISARTAANHALQALEWTGGSNSFVVQFVALGQVVIRAADPDLAVSFINKSLRGGDRRQQQIILFYGRSRRGTSVFIGFTLNIFDLLPDTGFENTQALALLLETLVPMLERSVNVRTPSGRTQEDLDAQTDRLASVVEMRKDLPEDLRVQVIDLCKKERFARKPRQREK